MNSRLRLGNRVMIGLFLILRILFPPGLPARNMLIVTSKNLNSSIPCFPSISHSLPMSSINSFGPIQRTPCGTPAGCGAKLSEDRGGINAGMRGVRSPGASGRCCRPKGRNPDGVEWKMGLLPRVARPSQPWASRRNPFGILERQHLPDAPKAARLLRAFVPWCEP